MASFASSPAPDRSDRTRWPASDSDSSHGRYHAGFFPCLTGMLDQNIADDIVQPHDLFGRDHDIRRLTLSAAQHLVHVNGGMG